MFYIISEQCTLLMCPVFTIYFLEIDICCLLYFYPARLKKNKSVRSINIW